jgi:hypothetical protein
MLPQLKFKKPMPITIEVMAMDEAEAKQMQAALQSFVGHFNTKEMMNAAEKLQKDKNVKMLKTFL